MDPTLEQPTEAQSPFAGLQQPQASPFSSLTPEQAPQALPEAQVDRTARLAALANSDQSDNDLLASYADIVNTNKETIRMAGDMAIRNQVASKQILDQTNTLASALKDSWAFDPTGELSKGITAAAQQVLAEGDAARAKTALEEEAMKRIQSLAASGDKTQAQLLLNNLEHGGARDMLTELNTKHFILAKALEDAGYDKHEQSYIWDIADFILSAVPLVTSSGKVGNVDIDKAGKSWLDNLFPGNRLNNEASAYWQLPLKEFAEFTPKLLENIKNSSTIAGYASNSARLNLLSEMDKTSEARDTNLFAGLDNVGLLSVAKPLTKAIAIPLTLVRQAGPKQAAELLAQTAREVLTEGSAAATAKSGVTMEELESHLVPKVMNPTADGLPEVPLSTRTNTILERIDQLQQKLPEVVSAPRLHPEELSAAIEKTVAEVSENTGDHIVNIDRTPVIKLTTGSEIHQVELTAGKFDGSGFANEKTARRWAESVGWHDPEFIKVPKKPGKDFVPNIDMSDEALAMEGEGAIFPVSGKTVTDESGQVFIKITRPVAETGAYTDVLNPQSWSTGLLRYVASSKNLSDEMLANAAQMAGNTQNRIFKTVVKPLADKINALNSAEKDQFVQVMAAANTNQKWFNTDQFNLMYQRSFGRPAKVSEHEAYQAFRDANDLEGILRNDSVYKELVLSGHKTVSFDTKLGSIESQNALVDSQLKTVPEGRVYDASADVHYNKNNPLTEKQLERLRAQGYRIVKTQHAVPLSDGTKINTFLVKPQELTVEELARDQIGWVEGGHRMYSGKHFVKQARRGVQSDTGEQFLENPSVHIAADTMSQARWWASQMEAARGIVNNALKLGKVANTSTKILINNTLLKTSDDLETLIGASTRLGSHAGLPTPAEFLKGLQDGSYSLTDAFEAVADRELPSAYRGADPSTMAFVTDKESGLNGFLRSQGRMYTGPKGEHLPDFNGKLAPTLDPFQTLNTALNNVAKLSSFSDYRTSAIQRWVKTYAGEIENFNPDWSAQRMFDKAVFRTGATPTPTRIKNAAETQRDIIRRNLSWQTEQDMVKKQTAQRISEWVSGSDPEVAWRQSLGKKTEDWMTTKNPLIALRGFAADSHLGFFNPAQLFLQMGTFATTMFMNAGDGAIHALTMSRPLRMFLMNKGGEAGLIDHYISKGLWKEGGFESPNEFKSYMTSAKQSGFFDFGRSHQSFNADGHNAIISDARQSWSKLRSAGMFFFNEGEVWNRLAAYRFAWRDAKKALPGVSVDSPEFLSKVAGRSEDWAMQMSQQSTAAWQHGLVSIPTQFWAYNMRMMEAAFGKHFTPAQRAKLVFSQLFLTGAAGTPITYELLHQYQKNTGETADLNTWQGMMQRGVLDTVVYHASGADVTLGERIGTGNFIPELTRSILGLGAFGEKSSAEVLGGPTLATVGNLGKSLHDVVRWSIAESGGDAPPNSITRDAVISLASNITTLSNINKAYLVWQYGTLRSNSGSMLSKDAPSTDAFAQLLGFAPGSSLVSQGQQLYLKNQQEQIDDMAKQIGKYRQKALLEPDRADDHINSVRLLTGLIPSHTREKVLVKADKYTNQDIYGNVAKRYQREKLQSTVNTDEQE